MALRFYLAGSAQSDHGNNWRSKIVQGYCFTSGRMTYGELLSPDELISDAVLPGGFDYVGAYIEEKGHNFYGQEREYASLHRQCLNIADALWAWLPGCGEGTWAEIGYATARQIPVIFAMDCQEKNIADDYEDWFVERFASVHRTVCGNTAREAWDKFAAAPMKYMRYDDYLNSGHWQRIRSAVYETYPKVCVRCGSPSNIQLHHLTYERVGREAWGDLIPLCGSCHQLEHLAKGAQP